MNESVTRINAPTQAKGSSPTRATLFGKYIALFAAVVFVALLTNGAFETWFSYQEHKTSLVRIQREQAAAAATKIEQFVKGIENQVGWTTQLPWSAGSPDQRRFDGLRLLRQVPAITELALLDPDGREQLRMSRLAMTVTGSQTDYSNDPKFLEAMARKVYYGPVYFRRESEPYMTLALASTQGSGVTVAEVNLKLIWEVVSQIKVGQLGRAYVVDSQGRLIAHPDISLVLRNTDLSNLSQVQAARATSSGTSSDEPLVVKDIQGRDVLTAHALIAPLGWLVFVDLPLGEAYAPLYASLRRSAVVLLAGLALAFVAGVFLARKMVVPIQALRAGAARIGSGDLSQRISINTGDELEALANQFNDMAGRLQESYTNLEKKVEVRTRELSEALDQQTATSEVLRVISSSPGELEPIFQTMLTNATRICEASVGILYRYDGDCVRAVSMLGVNQAFRNYLDRGSFRAGPQTGLGRLPREKRTIHIVDTKAEQVYFDGDPWRVATAELLGSRTLLNVPMLKDDELIGAIGIYRDEVRPFTEKQIELVTSFASQAVIAIENVRLLNELRARTDDLARSVGELRALGEVSQAVNSTLDLETVLTTIVAKAVQLSSTEAGAIYVFDDPQQKFRLRATHGMDHSMIVALAEQHIDLGNPHIASAIKQREPAQICDLRDQPSNPVNEIVLRAGYRALLIAPLLRSDQIIGVLVVRRRAPGLFPKSTVELIKTFAGQSVLAIQNAQLFTEIEEKGRQLAIASRHKSQFLANMSHELRTPLNAILGYTELIIDNIYGEPPEKMRSVVERVLSNGRHLLGLINEVLDLSKIEAGQLTLSVADYSMKDVVDGVITAIEPLAAEKRLTFKAEIQANLPRGRGDERRIAQVLLNLVGNAIKFTDSGGVVIRASAENGSFAVAVRDTGPGVSAADQGRIFDEFHQVDSSSTRKKSGTGLGLSIAKRIIEMHGGRIWVESAPDEGSTFSFSLPITVEHQALSS